MLIGIDIGGTFTDAVLIQDGCIIASCKRRTTKQNLMVGLLEALDGVLTKVNTPDIERVTLSTTVITNTVVEGKEEPVDLFVITGPGMNVDHAFPVEPNYISGYTDHRGIVVEEANFNEIDKKMSQRTSLAAVSAKFSVRNPHEEERLSNYLRTNCNDTYTYVSTGSTLSGSLNFPRRTISAYFNSAVYPAFARFKTAVEDALCARSITAPLHILKADGGALPMPIISERPVETVFTGPAATVLGLYGLGAIGEEDTVALDIGGTTTDISLWRNGKPLLMKHGVTIRNFPSAVRAFAVQSIGIGGESIVIMKDGHIAVGPERKGPSLALGGSHLTLGDALLALGTTHYGDVELAKQGILDFGKEYGLVDYEAKASIFSISRTIVATSIETIKTAIRATIDLENKRPVYVVADMVNPNEFTVEKLVVVGGTAAALGPLLAEKLTLPVDVPFGGAVANAIGAAVALPTIELTAHVDTKRRKLVVPELGIEQSSTLRTGDSVAKEALDLLATEANRLGLYSTDKMEVLSIEDFPVVEGWHSVERLITVKVQLQAGVTTPIFETDSSVGEIGDNYDK